MPFLLPFKEKLSTSPPIVTKPRRKLTQKLSQTLSIPIHTEPAREHHSASGTLSLRTAEISADFQQITPCTFRQRPATLISIAVRLTYTNDALPKNVRFSITFSAPSPAEPAKWPTRWFNAIWKTPDPSTPEITKAFGPKDLIGDPERIIDELNANLNLGGVPGCGIPGFSIGGKRTKERKFAWHVQGRSGVNGGGRASRVKKDCSQSYSWNIKANELDSMEVVPRTLTLWMVVVHGPKQSGAFRAQVAVEGRLKGLRGLFHRKVVVERRDFAAMARRGAPRFDEEKLAATLDRGDRRFYDATDAEIKACLVRGR